MSIYVDTLENERDEVGRWAEALGTTIGKWEKLHGRYRKFGKWDTGKEGIKIVMGVLEKVKKQKEERKLAYEERICAYIGKPHGERRAEKMKGLRITGWR
ncbi:MAG: hypothetical protein LBB09_02480 [Rickettsiales bacterium]|jgi:hypothetical protein|nr:hypothetical protein [Rickettsiales bacterium]